MYHIFFIYSSAESTSKELGLAHIVGIDFLVQMTLLSDAGLVDRDCCGMGKPHSSAVRKRLYKWLAEQFVVFLVLDWTLGTTSCIQFGAFAVTISLVYSCSECPVAFGSAISQWDD